MGRYVASEISLVSEKAKPTTAIAILSRKRCGVFRDAWFQCKYLEGHGGKHVYPDPVKWAQGLENIEEGPPPDKKA